MPCNDETDEQAKDCMEPAALLAASSEAKQMIITATIATRHIGVFAAGAAAQPRDEM
jgi:hypothetical protein